MSQEILFPPLEVKILPLAATLKVQDDEPVSCISSPLYLVITSGNRVTVLKEDTFEVIWEISADNPVSISLSDDSCLLLVAENAGLFNLYHIPTKQSVWSRVFKKELHTLSITKTYLSIDHSGSLKLYIFTKENIVFELSNISVPNLYSAIGDGNFNEVFDAAVLEEFDLSTLYPECKVTNSFQKFCSLQSVGLITQEYVPLPPNTEYYDVEDLINNELENDFDANPCERSIFQCYDFSSFGHIIKASSTRDGRYIVFLNDKHILRVMCSFTQMVLKTWVHNEIGGCIKSFVINETVDLGSSHVIEQKIGLLMEASPSGDINHKFEIRKFPSFELIHSTSLQHAQLIECKPNQDFWYVLDGELVEDSGRKHLHHLNLKAIFESLPEARLANLVNRRKFSEAEELAKIANLSSEVIHKTKIICIFGNLSANKYKNASESDLELVWSELEDSFKHIKDVEFIQSCISISLPEGSYMEKLLLCLKNWAIHNSSGNDVKDIISQVNQILNKLITHEVLSTELDSWCKVFLLRKYKYCLFMNVLFVPYLKYIYMVYQKLVSVFSSIPLKDFLNKNLLNYMITELKAGNLDISFIIWKRHKDELFHSLNSETLGEIIGSIPNSMSSKHLVPFLRDEFLPSVLISNPDTIDMVADWLIQRVYLAELYEKDLWPDNGRKLITTFLGVIHDLEDKEKTGEISFSTNLSFAAIHKKFVDTKSPVHCLSEFSSDLTWLVFLKSKFNCKISLADCQESKMNLIFAVLDRVDLQLVLDVIENFARPYSLEKQLDLEHCLEQYVKYALQTSCFTWWFWDEEPWEDRLIAVTNAIHCTDKWVNAALLVVSRAAVPWSQGIKDIVMKGMKFDHRRKADFENENKLVGLKEVLLKYDMKSFPINNHVQLTDVLVNYILKHNKDSALEDAKKVLLSVHDAAVDFDVHFRCLQYASNHNKLDDMPEILSRLSKDTAVKCAERLLKYFRMCLDDKFLIIHQNSSIRNMLHAGLYLIEYLKTAKKTRNEELLSSFRSLLKLQEEFSIYMTFSEITSRSHCKQVIDSASNDFLENKMIQKATNTYLRKHMPSSSGISQLNRLGDILSFEREEVMGFLITSCLQKEKYNLVLKLCQEFAVSYPSQKTAETLMQVVQHFYLNFKTIKDINFNVMIHTLCHLNNVAVTYCKEDSIVKYLDTIQLSTYVFTLKEITGQHSLSVIPEFTSDAYHKWKFYPIYHDEGFQLDCDLVTNYILDIYHSSANKSDYASMESSFNKIVHHMKDRGQGLAALRTIFMYHCTMDKTLELPTADISVIHPENSDISVIYPDNSIIEQITYTTAQNALSHRKMDYQFTYNLLATLQESSQQISLKALLKWCSSDMNRLTVVGKIGMEVANSLQDADLFTKFENIHKKASLLSRQSSKSVPPLSVILNSSSKEDNWAVAKNLILSQNVTMPIIDECCSAFQLRKDPVLIVYLNTILTESEKCLMFEGYDKEIDLALKKAEFVIGYITDETLLYNNFQCQLHKISPYNYDVLLFIEEQLINSSANIRTINSGTAEKEIQLLKFLQVYKRISPVHEIETSRWKSFHPIDTKPPAISNKRLPFHCLLTDKPQKIIDPELTANSLPVWLKIAPVLNIKVDHLVIIAVKNTVVSYLDHQSSSPILLNPDMRFVSIINDMLERIVEPESAACVGNWVTDKMPPGGNKVYFANMTVKFSKKWCQQGPVSQNMMDVHNKFLCYSQQSAIERVLYSNKLTSDEILSKVHSADKLIEHLIETYSLNLNLCMKACKAALEIGNITKIDTADIFLSFVLKWCKITRSTVANMDETFSEDLNTSDLEDADGDNVLRIINLLLSFPEPKYPNFYTALKLKFKELSIIQRSRLLFCLVSVFNTQTVSTALEVNLEILDESLVSLMCSVELEKLNLPYSRAMFANCNKTELVQRILSISNNSKAVIFCIRLCLEFDIWETSIWEVILKRMTMKPADYAVQDILQSTQGYLKHLWHSEAFAAAWRCVIQDILQMRPFHMSVFLPKLYKAVMRCPCVTSLDISFMTSELKYIMQTFDIRNVPELDSISDIKSLILNLSKMVDKYSNEVENSSNN